MGLDYAINLYYPVCRLGDALRALVQLAPAGSETVVRVPGGEVRVPFSADWKHDPIGLRACGSTARLETALLFPIDDAIASGEHTHSYEPFEDTACALIGCIYLTVRVGCLYAELSFAAATSGMSRLFVASDAIRGRFRELLAAAGGVVGWLDRETFEFYTLDDPERTISPELAIGEPESRYSPDWIATALCEGTGHSRPELAAVRCCRTADALAIARAAATGNATELLPILADALQDAGCDDERVLAHCRDTSRAHDGGCWVTSLVLG